MVGLLNSVKAIYRPRTNTLRTKGIYIYIYIEKNSLGDAGEEMEQKCGGGKKKL